MCHSQIERREAWQAHVLTAEGFCHGWRAHTYAASTEGGDILNLPRMGRPGDRRWPKHWARLFPAWVRAGALLEDGKLVERPNESGRDQYAA